MLRGLSDRNSGQPRGEGREKAISDSLIERLLERRVRCMASRSIHSTSASRVTVICTVFHRYVTHCRGCSIEGRRPSGSRSRVLAVDLIHLDEDVGEATAVLTGTIRIDLDQGSEIVRVWRVAWRCRVVPYCVNPCYVQPAPPAEGRRGAISRSLEEQKSVHLSQVFQATSRTSWRKFVSAPSRRSRALGPRWDPTDGTDAAGRRPRA